MRSDHFAVLAVALTLGSACGAAPAAECSPGDEGCPCLAGACRVGLTCRSDVCVAGAGTAETTNTAGDSDGGGTQGETTTNATIAEGTGPADSGSESGDCADSSPAIEPRDPATECLPGVPCVDDANCPDGHACNTVLDPPSCELIYCGEVGTPCHEESVCKDGLSCYEGRCNPCDFCGDLCEVDFATDLQHCGCCNNPVPAGGICNSGTPECSPGQSVCDAACVDLRTSTEHCGACGNALPPGVACTDGAPGCSNPDESLCEDGCVDLHFDDANCGSCGTTCTEGYCWGNGCCHVYVSDDTPRSCATVCAEVGMSCCGGSLSATYYGYCASDAIDLASCNAIPAAEIECEDALGYSCNCPLSAISCGCTP